MTKYSFGVRGYWFGDRSSPAELGDRFLQTLSALEPVDPIMRDWQLSEMTTLTEGPLAAVRPDIAGWVGRNVSRDDFDDPTPESGFQLLARSGLFDAGGGGQDSVNLAVTAGSRWLNEADMDIGHADDSTCDALLAYRLYRGAVEALASTWPCPFVSAYAVDHDETPVPVIHTSEDFERIVAEPWNPTPALFLRWIVYLSAQLASGFSPPDDLISEPTPGGGLILSATRDRLDPANPDHFRRALRLSKIMDAIVPEFDAPDYNRVIAARIGPY